MTVIRFGRAARVATFGAALAGLVAAAPQPAAAASEPVFPAGDAVARALLPYSPLIFDLAVNIARSFVEIGYDRRDYDPVTNTFFVSGLHVKRDRADVAIGRLRTDFRSVMIEDIAVDTRALDLPPQLRAALRKLGRGRIEGDILLGVKADPARSAYDIVMRYDLPGVGALAASASFDGLHIMVPTSAFERGRMSEPPQVTGALTGAWLAYEDYGLMGAAIEIAAGEANLTPEQLKAGLLAMPSQVAAQAIGGLPGGVSPALRERIHAWARTVEDFIRAEDALRIALAPAEPVQLARLQTGRPDEALVLALNPDVSQRFETPLAAPAAPGSLAAAAALISGAGTPQDPVAGARTLMTLAAGGNLDAVRDIAASFGDAPPPALEPAETAGLYGYLLVARALGAVVGDHALHRLTSGMEPQAVLSAEQEAARYFGAHVGVRNKPVNAQAIAGYDADALRALAYDYYEGRDRPRSFTEALSIALVAAAAGDSFAATLRDSLTAAAGSGAIVLDEARARAEADTLWELYVEVRHGRGQGPRP